MKLGRAYILVAILGPFGEFEVKTKGALLVKSESWCCTSAICFATRSIVKSTVVCAAKMSEWQNKDADVKWQAVKLKFFIGPGWFLIRSRTKNF